MPSDSSGTLRVRSAPLGLCWVVFGIFRLIVALWMFSFAGTATVMFGATLTRVPNPYALMTVFHFIYTGWIILSAVSGILGILAGITLLSGAGISRILAILAAFFSVAFVPVGTTIGIFTLVLFLRTD